MGIDWGVGIEMDLRGAGSEIVGFLGFGDVIHLWAVLRTVIYIQFCKQQGINELSYYQFILNSGNLCFVCVIRRNFSCGTISAESFYLENSKVLFLLQRLLIISQVSD
jgi:hypothetical protein